MEINEPEENSGVQKLSERRVRCGDLNSIMRCGDGPARRERGWSLMIFCARATRGLRRPSLDARSGRSISPHP